MSEETKRVLAIVALVLGILALAFAICLPICGVVLGLAGVVLGVLAVRSESKVLAIVALVMNALVLALSVTVWIVSAAWLMGKVELPGLPRPGTRPPEVEAPAGEPDETPGAPSSLPAPAPAE